MIPTRLGAVAAVRELRVARRPSEEALAFRAAVAEEREAEAIVVRDDAGHDEEDEQRQVYWPAKKQYTVRQVALS